MWPSGSRQRKAGPWPRSPSVQPMPKPEPFERGDAALQRLRAARAERHVPHARGLRGRQLQRMALVIVPAAQIDRVALAAALGHAHDVDEEVQALVRLRRQQLDVAEMGEIEDRFGMSSDLVPLMQRPRHVVEQFVDRRSARNKPLLRGIADDQFQRAAHLVAAKRGAARRGGLRKQPMHLTHDVRMFLGQCPGSPPPCG